MNHKPETFEELQDVVRQATHVLPRGGGTKPALSIPMADIETLDCSGLAGIVEYEPEELTFTALAGTPLAEVNALLMKHGQYLPFDPPLSGRGATLGGTLAAGLSGSGRYRYGGVRDFILGLSFVDGKGQLVRAGGKVVKNAAGFDLSKLMVGSQGSLGVIVETTFKVFPRPEAFITSLLRSNDLEEVLSCMECVAASRLALDAIDLEVSQDGYVLWVRMGGFRDALQSRYARLEALLEDSQRVVGSEEEQHWQRVGEMDWVPAEWSLVKVPLTVKRLPELERALAGRNVLRRYIAGGQAAWLAFEDKPESLEAVLTGLGLSGMVLFGPPGAGFIGDFQGRALYRRVRGVLDPLHRFVEV